MEDSLLQFTRFIKKHGLLSIAIVLFVIIGGWLFFASQKTYPLGDKLEYIGKDDYGCVLMCDSDPASTYYYATDMSVDDIAHAFKNATEDDTPQVSSTTVNNQDVQIKWLSFKDTNGRSFYIDFYEDPSQLIKYYHFPGNHKYIINIGSGSYPIVKDAL